jgi:hypothetical protein
MAELLKFISGNPWLSIVLVLCFRPIRVRGNTDWRKRDD